MGGLAEHCAGGDRLGTGRDGLGQPGGAPGMGMPMPCVTFHPSKGGKAASARQEEGFSVRSSSLKSNLDSEEKQRAFGGAGIYFIRLLLN